MLELLESVGGELGAVTLEPPALTCKVPPRAAPALAFSTLSGRLQP